MSSETSTEVEGLARQPQADGEQESGFQPWQLFTLAGLLGGAIVAFYAGNRPPSVRIALILTVFAAAAIAIAALRTLAPLTGSARVEASRVSGGRTRTGLEREKTLLLRSLKELEFDHAMGKLSEKDFAEMSARLRARAARIMRQLDAGPGYREAIEREIERRIGASGDAAPPSPVPEAKAAAAAAHEEATVGAADGDTTPVAPDCPDCGTRNDADARFCKACGARMEAA
jgi:hypothetical protein